ncbi:hypothetical protein TSAR_011246 [Trichomalopsis sarcophagae]|uniref:Uncharacterized protein n=1 Tax=Trichomalopsis sarcophagae TaxID=543379 RepID=A0A232F446_9HYME|nr:hypothetical protein TSAR_011246 [Trichomalopsis sarcophagae]
MTLVFVETRCQHESKSHARTFHEDAARTRDWRKSHASTVYGQEKHYIQQLALH